MDIFIIRELIYADSKIPAGTRASVLTLGDVSSLTDSQVYERAKKNYEKIGREGVFAFLDGKYRWLDKDDYEVIKYKAKSNFEVVAIKKDAK